MYKHYSFKAGIVFTADVNDVNTRFTSTAETTNVEAANEYVKGFRASAEESFSDYNLEITELYVVNVDALSRQNFLRNEEEDAKAEKG